MQFPGAAGSIPTDFRRGARYNLGQARFPADTMPPRKPKEFVYENAPLREVIVEVHWHLQRLASMPDAAIDPFFQILSGTFARRVADDGYVVSEPRMPTGIPIELLGHQVMTLFRRAPNSWPVYQIGPGVFTANIVPPYDGWSSFKPVIRSGLDHLFEVHPNRDFLRFSRVELRYMNIFTEAHGLVSASQFVRDALKLGIKPPKAVTDTALDGADGVRNVGTMRFALARPAGGTGIISWNDGTRGRKPVVTMDLTVRAEIDPAAAPVAIVEVLDHAHDSISRWFEGFVQGGLKGKMGEKRQL